MKTQRQSVFGRWRGIWLLVAASLTLGTVAACNGSDGSDAANGEGAKASASVDPAEMTGTVNWWGWVPIPDVANALIAEFNKTYPNITVNYKYFSWPDYVAALAPAIRSNEAPDVFDLASGGEGVVIATYGEYMLDLAPAAERAAGPDWKDQIIPAYIEMETRTDGAVVGLPFAGVAAGFAWVNQDLLDERNLTYPSNYDEWVDTCATLAQEGIGCLAVGAARGDFMTIIETVRAFANSVDPTFFYGALKGERPWDDQAWIDTLALTKRMYDDGILPTDVMGTLTNPDSVNRFVQGKALMIAMGSWWAQNTLKDMMIGVMEGAGIANPEPFTILPLDYPDVAGKGNQPAWFGDTDYGLAIPKNSKNIPAAEAFVAFMALDHGAQQTSVNLLQAMPVLVGMSPDLDAVDLVNPEVQKPAIAAMVEKAGSVTESRQWLMDTECVNAVYDSIVSVLDGSATPEDSAKKLRQQLG